jgi:glycosyltransferase involved in cell wall biosynthesis
MCTFNGERFLAAQLESIAAQDRAPDELVVCDDASSDRSLEIVRAFAARAPFLTRIEINNNNLGSTKNFERAIALCQGPIVVLADQDDVWYRHKLARIEEAFLRPNEPVGVFSDADLIDEESHRLEMGLWESFLFDRREQHQFYDGQALDVLVKRPVVTGATMAFRREFFDFICPIPAETVHDSWISFLLAACGRLEPISEPLMQYRRSSGQQIGPGPGPLTPLERIKHAHKTDATFYLEEIARFRQLEKRLEGDRSNFPNAKLAQREVKAKIAHLEYRVQLPRSRVARIPSVLREALKGAYHRYSAGWKSVAKDLTVAKAA